MPKIPPFLLAHRYKEKQDPSGYWMSEKFDGLRAHWDCKKRKLISRRGNEFFAPDSFKDLLPSNLNLDGELWLGRDSFQQTTSIVRTQNNVTDSAWADMKFMAFDAPNIKAVFEERLAQLYNHIDGGVVHIVEQIQCEGPEHLTTFLASIEAKKGEGVMLREPCSLYVNGRSWTCMKVKSWFDMEGTIVGFVPGKGKHTGRLGGYTVDVGNNQTFTLGTGLTDTQRENPEPIGTRVTFRYKSLTKLGIPREANWIGVCIDK